jgi:hypothetical protein
MLELVRAHPATQRHVVDLPYRLASDSMQNPENVRLWERDGALVAWAAWQQPFVTLDHAITAQTDHTLADDLLDWACMRFARIARAQGRELHYFVDARADDPAWRALLERHGFEPDPAWQLLHCQQHLGAPTDPADVPADYAVRPLAGEVEIEPYVHLHRAAFGTANMTVAWRQRILGAAQYAPDLDLVAVAPDGALAAFCIGWLHQGVAGCIRE